MPGNVRERLLQDPEHRGARLRRRFQVCSQVEAGLEFRSFLELRHEPLGCRRTTKRVQDRRPKFRHDSFDAVESRVDHGLHTVDHLPGVLGPVRSGSPPPAHRAQIEFERGQRLTELVVKFAGERRALILPHPLEPFSQSPERLAVSLAGRHATLKLGIRISQRHRPAFNQRLEPRHLVVRVEMKRDQIGKQGEHADRLRRTQMRRSRIDGTQRAEETPVAVRDGNRDVALETVLFRGRVVAEPLIRQDVVDGDPLAGGPDLVADRGFDWQFTTGLEPEGDFVPDGTGDPAVLRDSRHRREAETRRPTNHFEDLRHGVDLRNDDDIVRTILHLDTPPLGQRSH